MLSRPPPLRASEFCESQSRRGYPSESSSSDITKPRLNVAAERIFYDDNKYRGNRGQTGRYLMFHV
jgi:hypothetical protein